ncbi:MAG: hypothetical protein IJJ25_05320 [Lachnospiraceae bacterium]|nr:hypothetical protein [Lachnospiraceae bacterium]
MKKMLRILAGILLFTVAVSTCAAAEEPSFLRQISGGLAKLPPPNEMQALSLEEVEKLNESMGAYTPAETILAKNNAPAFYYYDQLNPMEREIYDIIVMIAQDPVEENVGVMITDMDPDSEEFQEAYMRAMYSVWFDHPEFFWLYWYTEDYIGFGSHVDEVMANAIYIVYFFIEKTYKDYEEKTTEFNEAVQAFLADINTNATEYEIAKQIHDKLIDLAEYNHPVSEFGAEDLAHTAYGALVRDSSGNPNLPVCDGYSLAFEYLLQQCGIEAAIIGGSGGATELDAGGHAWNIIKLDGAWYEVDSTWDDSMRSTEGVYDQDVIEALMNPSFREKMGHYMFLISTEHMTHYEPNAEEFTYYSNAGWYIPFYEGMSSVHIRDSNHNGKAATGIGQIAMNSVIDTAPVADYDYGVYY